MRTTATKEKILDATMLLVSQRGYRGATTREIARAAGVTELTLFRHFGSKERLFEQCMGDRTFLPALKELLPDLEQLPYAEALRLIGRKFLLSLKERKPVVMIMQSEMTRSPMRMRRIYSQFMDEMRGILGAYFSALQKRGVLRRFPVEVAARMFLGMLFSYFRSEEIMLGRDITKQRRMDRAVGAFVDIFAHGTLRIRNGGGKRRRT